jgi:hypothetical protein
MSDGTVIELRNAARTNPTNRPQRRLELPSATVPILLAGDVCVSQLLRALDTLGCTFYYDERLCAVVIMPAAQSAS